MKGSKNLYSWYWFLRLESLRPVQLPTAVILAACCICFASCSQQVEYTDEQRACIARQFSNFDPKKLSQCVDVCKVCMRGNTVALVPRWYQGLGAKKAAPIKQGNRGVQTVPSRRERT
jgi:hypothetical protein